MRIKKTSQTTTLPAQVVNTNSNSTEDTYSCGYANKAFGGTILWTNPNPTSTFASGDIYFDNTEYSSFNIIFRINTTFDIRNCQKIYKNSSYRIFMPGYNDQASKDYMMVRDITALDDKFSFSECYGYGIGSITEFNSSMNNCVIPIQIIGYK